MQWLVDLVYAMVLSKGFYFDRGDPAVSDFTTADFLPDDNWHDFDLSAIVPTEAKAVLLDVQIKSGAIGEYLMFRRAGNVNSICRNGFKIEVAAVGKEGDLVCACNKGHSDYRSTVATVPAVITVNVKAWWK